MYVKNKYKVNQIKKERRARQNKTLETDKLADNSPFKKHEDHDVLYQYSVVDQIFESIQPLSKMKSGIQSPMRSPKNSQFMTSFKKGQDLVRERLSVQDFVVDKSLSDVILFDNVIKQYEQSQFKTQFQAIRKANSNISDINNESLLDKITQKFQNKINVVTLDSSTLPALKDNKNEETRHLFEEIFIAQIMNRIVKHGLQIMSQSDYRDFKRIVAMRKKVLQNLSDQIRVEKLFQIKQKMSAQYNQQIEEQGNFDKMMYQKLKQDEYLKCTSLQVGKHHLQSVEEKDSIEMKINLSQEVSIDNTTGFFSKSQIANENFKNFNIKLSPITKNRKTEYYQGHIKSTLLQDNIPIGSINMSDLQTNREKGSMQLDFTSIEEREKNKKGEDDYEEEEDEDDDNIDMNGDTKIENYYQINQMMHDISDKVNNLVMQPTDIQNLQERIKQRMAERNHFQQNTSLVSQGSYLDSIAKEKKASEKYQNESFFQQERSQIQNQEQQSTRYMSQINEMNSINRSNNNNNNNINSNSNLIVNSQNQQNSQIDILQQQYQEQDETIELLLDVAQKHGLEEELMKLFTQEEGSQPLDKQERDARVQQFMKKVQEYIKEEEFQEKLKDKQKSKNIKFQKMEKKKIKKTKAQKQNVSEMNVLDDTSLLNAQFSRGPSLHVDYSSIAIDAKQYENEDNQLQSKDNLILPLVNQTPVSETDAKLTKKFVSSLNFSKMKKLPIPKEEEESTHVEGARISQSYQQMDNLTNRSSLSSYRQTENKTKEDQGVSSKNYYTYFISQFVFNQIQYIFQFNIGQKNPQRKQKKDIDYYNFFNENQPHNTKKEDKGNEKQVKSQREISKADYQRQKVIPKSQRQVAVADQKHRLLQSMKKNNQDIQRARIINSDFFPTKQQMLKKKQDLDKALKINFSERKVDTSKISRGKLKSGENSPRDKNLNSTFRKSQQPLHSNKKEDIIQQQRRQIMIKYHGEEMREEIMQAHYTLDEEINAKEKIKAREETLKMKMNIAATKMTIQQEKLDDLDPEMLIFQDILTNHKKANDKLFHKIISPQKNLKKVKHRIHFQKKLSEQLGVINNQEDNIVLDELKHSKTLKLPGFFQNQELLEDLENGVFDDIVHPEKKVQKEQIEIKILTESLTLEDSKKTESEHYQQAPSLSVVDVESQIIKTQSDQNQPEDTLSEVEDEDSDNEQINEESGNDEDNEDEEDEDDQNDLSVENKSSILSISKQDILTEQEVVVEKEIIDNQGQVTIQKVIETVVVQKQPKKITKNTKSISPPKKKKVEDNVSDSLVIEKPRNEKKKTKIKDIPALPLETIEGPSEIQTDKKVIIKKEKKTVKSPRVSISENIDEQIDESKDEKPIKAKVIKKKKSATKKKKVVQDTDSNQEDVDDENDDSVNEVVNTPQSTKTKKKKKTVEESNFLKIPETKSKKPTKKKRDTIQLDDSYSSSPKQSSLLLSGSIQQSVAESSNVELSPKSKKKQKELRLKQEKKQRMEEEKQKKEEERLKREEERQKKEEERLRKEEEKRKIEQEKQRIKEEKQRRFNMELQKAREFNFADEMELLKKRNLTLRQLKEEIEYTIEKLENDADEEAKYNILSCNQQKRSSISYILYKSRLDQVTHFLESVEESIDLTISNRDHTDTFLRDLFSTKQRWTRDRYKEKLMKFQKEIQIPEADDGLFADVKGDAVGEQEIQLILKYASLNQDVEGILKRLIQFKEDNQFLQSFKSMIINIRSKVTQIGLDTLNYRNQTLIHYDEIDEQRLMQRTQHNTKQSTDENVLTNEQMLIRLRKLKKYNKNRFDMVLQNSNQIKDNNNFLKSINYAGGIDQDFINNLKVARKQQIWNSKLKQNIF